MSGLLVAQTGRLPLDNEVLTRYVAQQILLSKQAPDFLVHSGDVCYSDNPFPAEITLDEGAMGRTRDELLAQLREGEPCIALSAAGTSGVYLNPQTLETGQEEIVVARIAEILAED